jgi:hypothetical protein
MKKRLNKDANNKTEIPIELLNNNSHGLLPPGGLVSPSGGFVSLLCDQPGPSNGILH